MNAQVRRVLDTRFLFRRCRVIEMLRSLVSLSRYDAVDVDSYSVHGSRLLAVAAVCCQCEVFQTPGAWKVFCSLVFFDLSNYACMSCTHTCKLLFL